MQKIETIAELEALYPRKPSKPATLKVASRLTPSYRKWIEHARFCVVATAGPEGLDASPRGDDGPVVMILDEHTLALPDWRGNNRLDSLRNILRDGRISLMFMVPGARNVVRVNGTAVLSPDPDMTSRFDRNGKRPVSVTVITIQEVYAQCARAVIRSRLWSAEDESGSLPTFGDILKDLSNGEIDGAKCDGEWEATASETLW